MIKNEDLNKIVDECRYAGLNITVRDIAYTILCRYFDDEKVSYKIAFGIQGSINENDAKTYAQGKEIAFVRAYMDSNYGEPTRKKKRSTNGDDISFEENKAEIIKLIKETKDKEERGEIDAKQSLDLQTKLRVTLNDKFNVNSEVKEQLVYVNCKYNSVCECGREIYIPTKEELMSKYNLIENKEE